MCWAIERGFASEARAPSAARHFVGTALVGLLAPLGQTDTLADAELVVSELVTNSVRSGAAAVRVGVELHHGELELDVADDGPGWPTLASVDMHQANGRGLILVDALADHWQVEPIESGGKRVRVVLAVAAELTTLLHCRRPPVGQAGHG
ncbi:MAG: ATP-binding protein [Actinomycetota bacterium]|nr:ATP-binding protein [Actinomycetota bacterium]